MDVYSFQQRQSIWLTSCCHGLAFGSLLCALLSLYFGFTTLVVAAWFFYLRWWLLEPQSTLIECSELGEVTVFCTQRGVLVGQLTKPQFTGLCQRFVLNVYASETRQQHHVCWWLDAFNAAEQSRLRRIAANVSAQVK